MPPAVTHNAKSRRFETGAAEGALAFLLYTIEGNHITLEHTFVPVQLRGTGVGANLARAALSEARRRHWRVIAHCPYVAGFITRHPEFADLVDPEP
jgi:predicted GNAT family acetyltransferase